MTLPVASSPGQEPDSAARSDLAPEPDPTDTATAPVAHSAPLPDLPPSEQDEQARHRLLRAAVEVFDRKGYAGASVRELVERAGFSKPALYYHFGSKEGVLQAILEAAQREFGAAVARGAASGGSAEARIGAICEEVYRLSSRNVPVVRVAHSVTFGSPGGAPSFDFTFPERILEAALRPIVEAAVASGEFRAVSVGDLVLVILAILGECIHREVRYPDAPVGVERLHQILAMVLGGALGDRPAEAGPQECRAGRIVAAAAGSGPTSGVHQKEHGTR